MSTRIGLNETINLDQVGRVVIIRHHGRLYDHYGILDGKNGIIHVHKRKGMITCDPLEKALKNAKKVIYLDDDLETRWNTYKRASSLIGSKHTYRFFSDNCETMVQHIRTGDAYSEQVNSLTKGLATVLLTLSAIRSFDRTDPE